MTLYRFMGFSIGVHSHDWHTFILFRRSRDVKIRKYPNHVGLSTSVLMDLVNHGTKVIVVKIDGHAVLRTDPKTWLEQGTVDKLTPDQDPHAFLPVALFDKMADPSPFFTIKRKPKEENDQGLGVFL